EEKDFSRYTNSQSMVLFPHKELEILSIPEYLDLSPFFIDKATYLGRQSPAVYVLTAILPGGALRYQSVDFDINGNADNIADWELVIDQNNKPFRVVWEQFQYFLKDFNLQTI